MKLETGKITPTQLMFSVACFLQASALLTAFLAGVADYDSWFVVVVGIVLYLPVLMVYIRLMNTYPGKNLIEINELTFGKVLGKVVSLLYLWFFLTLATLNLRDLDVFVKQTVMIKTPDVVLMVVCVLVSTLAVRYGIQVVTRYGFLFILLSATVLSISLLLALRQIDLKNFLPMLQQPVEKYIQGTNIILSIPFGELVVFLMIVPYVREKKKTFGRFFLGGFLLGALMLLLVVFRDTAVLGNTVSLFALPAFETLRLVTLFGTISRVEFLFAAVLIIMLFFKITILYYVTSLTIAQVFGMKSYRPVVLVTGVLMIGYGFTLYPSNIQHADSSRETAAILWQFFEFLLPLLTLVVGKIKKGKSKEVAV
jgi:spore germination protein KB